MAHVQLRGVWIAASIGALLAIAPPAYGQERGIQIDRFRPALDREGFLGMQGTATPGPGRWNLGLTLGWADSPLTVASGGEETDVIAHRVTGDVIGQVGIGGRLALALDLPFVLYQSTDAAPLADDGPAVGATALADPRFVLRYRFFGEDATIARERNEGPGVAVLAAASAPLGDDDAFAGEKGVSTWLELTADFHVFGAGAGAMLGWRHRFEPQDFLGVRFRDELEFGVALKVPIPVTYDFLGLLEIRGVTDAGSPFGDEARTAVEGDLGLSLRRGDLAWNAAVGTGFTAGVGTPTIRTVLGVTWSPRVRDADGDGIADDRDECGHLPEDFDGFEDSDGCLDPDNDGDLIPDADDRCVNEAAEEFRDEDEDGCTDPMRDGDGDGVEDGVDACADAAEDRDGHQDEDGCPDLDNDGDGIADAQDRCPNDAEDRDGFEDEDGCADADNDGDGVGDDADACDGDAEDVDQFEDQDGCPDPDNDRDGVADASDQCAAEAETINGVTDEDGCPDRGGRALWQIAGEGDAVQITGRVRFAAGDVIAPASTGSVDQLARLLVARWPTSFRVAIGETAQARVDALRAALVERGVPASRVRVETDASLRGGRVVVTPVPAEAAAPEAPRSRPEAPAPAE